MKQQSMGKMVLHDTPIYKKDPNDTVFTSGKAILVASMSVLNVFILLGNSMSIITIITSSSLRRQVSYWFVLNLAVTDLLISVTILPLNIVWEYYGVWPFGEDGCKFITFADNSFSTVSAYSIVLVSIDKYLYIAYPLHYHYHMTKRLTFILITAVWICVCVLSSVSIFAGLLSSHFEDTVDACVFVVKDTQAVVSAALSFFMPLVALCFTTSRIICIASRHIKRIHATPSFTCTDITSDKSTCTRISFTKATNNQQAKMNSISSVLSLYKTGLNVDASRAPVKVTDIALPTEPRQLYETFPSEVKTVTQSKSKMHQARQKKINSCQSFTQTSNSSKCKRKGPYYCKLFGTVTLVIGCFILMFAPLYVALITDISCHCIPPWVYEDILVNICHSHALVNPFIYILTDRKYKMAFKRLWKRTAGIFCSEANVKSNFISLRNRRVSHIDIH